MIRALIFDCFGVFYADPVFAYMRDSSTPPEKAQAFHALDDQAARGKLTKSGFIEQASALLGCTPEEADQRFFHSDKRNDRLVTFAQHARKHYKVGLLSNIGGDMMDGFFGLEEQRELFDEVILSGNVGIAKPDPAIFKMMLNKLGVEPQEAVFVDDSQNHIDAARQLGINCIRFESNEQFARDISTYMNVTKEWL
jgi:epoxide hydrolase-like predicted phosphatase